MNNLTAIILAGGRGKRLGALTTDIPKPLLQVDNKSLIAYNLDFVKKIGATKIIVVGSYLIEKLKEEINRYDFSIQVIQSDFNLHTLDGFSYALPYIADQNILVCNADYIFSEHIAEAIKRNLQDISVYCSHNITISTDDVMKVQETADGLLLNMSKTLENFESIFTGVFYCSQENISQLIKKTSDLRNSVDRKVTPIETVLVELARTTNILVADVGESDWFEIDTAEEWNAARSVLEK